MSHVVCLLAIATCSSLADAMASSSRRAKVDFTETEKLVKAYDDGMDNVSKEKLPVIEKMAQLLNKEEKQIKVGRAFNCSWAKAVLLLDQEIWPNGVNRQTSTDCQSSC